MISTSDINKYFASYLNNESIINNEQRKYFVDKFHEKGIPTKHDEMWRDFDWSHILKNKYIFHSSETDYQSIDSIFRCNVQDFDTYLFSFLNGKYVHNNNPLTIHPNGVIIGSFAHAQIKYKNLTNNYLERSTKQNHTSLFYLASALQQDGFFVYIPDGIELITPIQIVNLVDTNEKIFINTKNMVILGKNSSLKLIHCDDSLDGEQTLFNTATEIFLEENAHLDYYKLENKGDQSVLINDLTIYQEKNSQVNTHTNVFNGGLVHNTINSHLLGEQSNIQLNGLFLVDKQQQISNCLSIHHHVPQCHSKQLYNGIADDKAQAHFVGHIFVAPDAQKTEAYQVNHNMLLTDDAHINTKPFLEIYADDVKCSHGATVGQLDNEAIFYLRSRGICEKNAKMLLMHAFAKEVLDNISIPALASYTENLVEKRLSGENISCTGCTKNCENKSIAFEIKMPEI